MAAWTRTGSARGWLKVLSMAALLFPAWGLAAAPGARSFPLTPLEESLVLNPQGAPAMVRQPVLGYLHATSEGWQLVFPPAGVSRVGLQPAPTDTVDAALEDLTSNAIAPHAVLFRVDF
ncbi:hypothetical protein [Stigmatella aurantiaca]|uniref:Uncharacterized protein n=1 Tax=Stigmatella aurantiaca (strain DW4/3-1) TaxID=378806 RepID=Q097T0_STIAD|nr:hypothetical protein [Stigmatella aurantiaca]ADO68429.1 uncharacterized protein STAUR_0625 [Stigmatella aurantiaca DW4/3-1]EAU68036.1 hypothetical protein STIAU_0825 [Stigmatella aurantiaca DW4/3-1]